MLIGSEQQLEKWRDTKPAIFVEFFHKPVEDKKATLEAGRIVYKDEEWANIHKRGELGHVVPMPVKMLKQDSTLWPFVAQQYEGWKAGLDPEIEGTPLKAWPHITPAFLRNCEAVNVFNVESLANLPDGALRHIGPGAIDLRNKARAYLNASNDIGKATEKMAALESENANLRDSIEELRKAVAELSADKPRRRIDPMEHDAARKGR